MKTIHKITLGIALAIVAVSACIVSTHGKSDIKDMLLSQNVEALTEVETTTYKTRDYRLMWESCSSEKNKASVRARCWNGTTTCTSRSCD